VQLAHHICARCSRLSMHLSVGEERCCAGCLGADVFDGYYHEPCTRCACAAMVIGDFPAVRVEIRPSNGQPGLMSQLDWEHLLQDADVDFGDVLAARQHLGLAAPTVAGRAPSGVHWRGRNPAAKAAPKQRARNGAGRGRQAS